MWLSGFSHFPQQDSDLSSDHYHPCHDFFIRQNFSNHQVIHREKSQIKSSGISCFLNLSESKKNQNRRLCWFTPLLSSAICLASRKKLDQRHWFISKQACLTLLNMPPRLFHDNYALKHGFKASIAFKKNKNKATFVEFSFSPKNCHISLDHYYTTTGCLLIDFESY